MKNTILLIGLLLIFSCKKEEKPKLAVPKMKQDSLPILQDKEAKLTDEEILKIQQKEEKDRSQIVREYTLSKKEMVLNTRFSAKKRKVG